MTTCPKCGNQAGEGAVFCDRCGTRLPLPEPSGQQAAPVSAGGSVICNACGAGNVPGEAFCDSCGSPLETPLPAAPAEAAAAPAGADLAPAPEPSPEAAAAPEPAAAEPAVAAEPTAAPLVPLAALACPACGAAIVAGEAFCADCGASLAQPPIPPEPVTEAAPETLPEAIAPAEVDVAPVAAAPEPTPAPVACPACGAEVEPTDKFCSNCGLGLALAPAGPVEPPAAAAAAIAAPTPAAPAGPRLVVVASGAEIVLPAKDEILIGREDPVSGLFPDADLAPHGGEDAGVSRRHARIVVEGGRYFIEDLNSTNYTFVNKVKLAPKTRQPLADGDEIRCGRAALIFRAA